MVADSDGRGGRFGLARWAIRACLVADSGLFGGRFGPHPSKPGILLG